jgi:hypothetical protein
MRRFGFGFGFGTTWHDSDSASPSMEALSVMRVWWCCYNMYERI